MHYVVLYPQNGDRIMTIVSVTSLYPVYSLRQTVHTHRASVHQAILHQLYTLYNLARYGASTSLDHHCGTLYH